ncbi:zinc-binding CMP/dCMP deaminase [Psychromonas sp. CNPT3]|uniref:cytidine deaminase n=1 Tax=Psychromonas sp. CNPT3 TaxID=314282 RepID=UPI00006E4279|nr:cytidine deaminase [Psychromonas sp. CNPT3]AGH82136.1 zinc-binding CMP/dCMP deaminase [Psychromonas sp. CNPT3]
MNYFNELKTLLDCSSAPYSGFNVASIVVTVDGKVYKGVNVESAAYPTTNCAERNALQTAITEGTKLGEIKEVHILARNAQKTLVQAYPCGSCRQVIAELSANDAMVFCYASATEIAEHSIAELLPHAFLGADL